MNSLRWNGAAYDEEFDKFQFAVLFPPNSLTGVQNAPSARILGVETNVDWRATEHLTLSAGGSYNDAVLTAKTFCGVDQSGQLHSDQLHARHHRSGEGTATAVHAQVQGQCH